MLKDWIGAEEGEAASPSGRSSGPSWACCPASQVPDVFPHLARLLSLRLDPAEEERLGRARPTELARRDPPRLSQWVAASPEQGPVVVAIEDVHWADPRPAS